MTKNKKRILYCDVYISLYQPRDRQNKFLQELFLISILVLVSKPEIDSTNYHSRLYRQNWKTFCVAVSKVETLLVLTGLPPSPHVNELFSSECTLDRRQFFVKHFLYSRFSKVKGKNPRIYWSSCPMSFNWMVPAISFNRELYLHIV